MKISLLLSGSCRVLLLQILLGALVFEVKAELHVQKDGRIEITLAGKPSFSRSAPDGGRRGEVWQVSEGSARKVTSLGHWLPLMDVPRSESGGMTDGLAEGVFLARSPEFSPALPGSFLFLQRQLRPPPQASA